MMLINVFRLPITYILPTTMTSTNVIVYLRGKVYILCICFTMRGLYIFFLWTHVCFPFLHQHQHQHHGQEILSETNFPLSLHHFLLLFWILRNLFFKKIWQMTKCNWFTERIEWHGTNFKDKWHYTLFWVLKSKNGYSIFVDPIGLAFPFIHSFIHSFIHFEMPFSLSGSFHLHNMFHI